MSCNLTRVIAMRPVPQGGLVAQEVGTILRKKMFSPEQKNLLKK
jgi:hypothetical protein